MAPVRKSVVWSFFDKSLDNRYVVCRLCNQHLKYFASTSNLRQHIIRKHPIQYHEHINRDNPCIFIETDLDSPNIEYHIESIETSDVPVEESNIGIIENQSEELNWSDHKTERLKTVNKRLKSVETARRPLPSRRQSVAQTFHNPHLDEQYAEIAKLKLELLRHQLEMSKKEEIAKDREASLRQKSLELTLEIKKVQLKNLTVLNNT